MEAIPIADPDRKFVHRAIVLYTKALERCRTDLDNAGKDEAADRMKDEIEALQTRFADPKEFQVLPTDSEAVKKGLEILAKNQLAAAGTATGVCEEDWAQYMREVSEDTKVRLMPMFDTQVSLQFE
jgi:hypothetical protein